MSTPDQARAWSGPSGLRVECLAPAGEPRHGAATVAVEPSPGGEPLWFTPPQWADLCAACAELGPGFAPGAPAATAAAALPAEPGR